LAWNLHEAAINWLKVFPESLLGILLLAVSFAVLKLLIVAPVAKY